MCRGEARADENRWCASARRPGSCVRRDERRGARGGGGGAGAQGRGCLPAGLAAEWAQTKTREEEEIKTI